MHLQGGSRGTLRPNYTWGVLHGAMVARTLRIERIAALEFGVAGGNGLVALEAAARAAEEHLGVGVEVVGFDNAVGLPPPADHRDAPFLMEEGHFPMDVDELRTRLERAELRLGLVADTVGEFVAASAAPVGFISFDLDYYSSTRDAFALLEAPPDRFLPRFLAYFDDTLGYPWGEFNGAQLAISEFNERHETRKLAHLQGLRFMLPGHFGGQRWTEAMYLTHLLDHPRYAEYDGTSFSTRLDLAR